MSNPPVPNPTGVQTEEAAFQSEAANIEVNIRKEIDSRHIWLPTKSPCKKRLLSTIFEGRAKRCWRTGE
jgi:hypothetical protein